jgi:hypothetical protein
MAANRFLSLFLLTGLLAGCKGLSSSYPSQPGTLFVRQSICDLDYFKKTFLGDASRLSGQGFTSWGLYREIHDPKTYILVFRCRDLQKGVEYLQSPHYKIACGGPWNGILWAGLGLGPRGEGGGGGMKAGLAIVRREGWNEAARGPDLEREGLAASENFYPLPRGMGGITVYESPDVFKVWDTLRDAQGFPRGSYWDAWFGIRLQEGRF